MQQTSNSHNRNRQLSQSGVLASLRFLFAKNRVNECYGDFSPTANDFGDLTEENKEYAQWSREIFDVSDTQQTCDRIHDKSVERARHDELHYVGSLLNRYFTSIRKTQLRTPLAVLVVVLARSIFLVDGGICWACGFRRNKRAEAMVLGSRTRHLHTAIRDERRHLETQLATLDITSDLSRHGF
jgi:hypothetical protein